MICPADKCRSAARCLDCIERAGLTRAPITVVDEIHVHRTEDLERHHANLAESLGVDHADLTESLSVGHADLAESLSAR